MSTNPFVCQPNSQKIGGFFLPFFKGTCAGLIATRRSTPDSVFPRPYKTKVQHAVIGRLPAIVISMKMMDCLALETLVSIMSRLN